MSIGTRRRGGRRKAAGLGGAVCLIAAVVLAGCTTVPAGNPQPSTSASTSPAAAPSPPDADFAAIERDLTRALTQGDPELGDVRSVLVSVAGETVIEYYHRRKPTDHAHVWSVTKSVIGILVGIAVDEGLLQVDQTLVELLPDHAAVMSDAQRSITLKQLLTMTAGVSGDDGGLNLEADDTVAQMLAYPTDNEPGVLFTYSNSSSHLVAAVLRRAVDRPLLDYAREKLFDPLDIDTRPAWQDSDATVGGGFEDEGFGWVVDSDGTNLGAWGLKLTSPDLVKLGELYVNEGTWRGRQIVSAAWVHESTSSQLTADQEGSDGQYGYLWWVGDVDGHPAFLALGSFHQRIYGIPSRQTVLVVTASDDRGADDIGQILDPVLNKVFASLMQ